MAKLSEAEKKRRKEREIIDRATHILNIMWACRDGKRYNGLHTWSKKELDNAEGLWEGFVWGITIAYGYRWSTKLDKLYGDYAELHGPLYKTKEV